MKKAIIALISLLIFCIVFPSTVSAESARSHYKPRLTAPTSDNAYYNSKLNRYSQTGYGMPNCVAYAYGRVYEMNGKAPRSPTATPASGGALTSRAAITSTAASPRWAQ